MKAILKSDAFQSCVAWLLSKYLSFVFYTTRWKFENFHILQDYIDRGEPFIAAFWHNRLAMMTYGWKNKKIPFYMIISLNSDGRLISRIIKDKKIATISGSSSRGGDQVIRDAVLRLQEGGYVGITPDGPRGPRYSCAEGIVQIARLAKVDMIPATYSIKRRKVIGSWDKLIFPLPFSKGVFKIGEPVEYEAYLKDDKVEEAREEFRKRLMDITSEADKSCGHEPFEPGKPRRRHVA